MRTRWSNMKPVDENNSTPFVTQVERNLALAIERGELKKGQRLQPVRELAKQLAVGKTTVAGAIARLAAKGLLCSRPGRGTYVTAGDSDPAQRRNGNIGLAWWNTAEEIMKPGHSLSLYELLCSSASSHSNSVILLPGSSAFFDGLAHIRQLGSQGRLDGILYFISSTIEQEVMEIFKDLDLPVVIIDSFDKQYDCDSVVLNNKAGADEAMAQLLNLGHKRIAFLNTHTPTPNALERLECYRTALQKAGIDYSDDLVREAAPGMEQGRKAMKELLPFGPTAVFTFNQLLAEGAILAAGDTGLSVPEDFSVIGFGGSARDVDASHGLTTVVYDPRDLASTAVDRLLARIDGDTSPGQRIRIPTFLRNGETTAAARTV